MRNAKIGQAWFPSSGGRDKSPTKAEYMIEIVTCPRWVADQMHWVHRGEAALLGTQERLWEEGGIFDESEIYTQVRRLPAISHLYVRCPNYWFSSPRMQNCSYWRWFLLGSIKIQWSKNETSPLAIQETICHLPPTAEMAGKSLSWLNCDSIYGLYLSTQSGLLGPKKPTKPVGPAVAESGAKISYTRWPLGPF